MSSSQKIFLPMMIVFALMITTIDIMSQDTASRPNSGSYTASSSGTKGGDVDSARNTAINTNSDGSARNSSSRTAHLITDSSSVSNAGDTDGGMMHHGLGKYGLLGLLGLFGLLGLRRNDSTQAPDPPRRGM